jgi:hypothetical protein
MTSLQQAEQAVAPTATTELRVLGLLGVSLLFFGAMNLAIGPDTLQENHIEMGRALLRRDPRSLVTPAYPIFGYALIIAALGPWTLLLNIAVGFLAYAWVFRELELGRKEPPITFYLATLGYAALTASWNDHALLLSIVLISLAILHRYGIRDWATGAVIGFLWGLAYNIRTDALLLFPIFTFSTMAQSRLAHRGWGLAHHAAAAATFLALMLPWAAYTTNVLGKYTPTSTNGWGVVYLGFGLVPGNRLGLQPRDESLGDKAKLRGEASPWSAGSNDYFREEVFRLVSSDPGMLINRVRWGFIHAVRVGVSAPDLRKAAAQSPEHYSRLHTAFQNLKKAIGLPANYKGEPPADTSISAYDTAVILADLLLRAVLGLTFVIVGMQCLLLLRRPGLLLRAGPVTAVAASLALYWCLVACLLFPIERLNTMVLTFAAVLLQRALVVQAVPQTFAFAMPAPAATPR